jgi:hypothetical protein
MDRCEGCELNQLGNKYRVCIPLPSDQIRGCLISRDPTSEFLGPLKKYKQLPSNQKRLLDFDAPPCWLYKKIGKFMDFDENTQEMYKLRSFFNQQCYWTHLHKCPTCKPGKNIDKKEISDVYEYFPSFRYSTAKKCAERWFEFEFDKYGLKDKIIITCGRDVEKFVNQWSEQHLDTNDNNIINLPHPSGANCGNGWSWKKSTDHTERITKEINRFLDLI